MSRDERRSQSSKRSHRDLGFKEIKVKEEPISDAEDTGSRSHKKSRSHPTYDKDGDVVRSTGKTSSNKRDVKFDKDGDFIRTHIKTSASSERDIKYDKDGDIVRPTAKSSSKKGVTYDKDGDIVRPSTSTSSSFRNRDRRDLDRDIIKSSDRQGGRSRSRSPHRDRRDHPKNPAYRNRRDDDRPGRSGELELDSNGRRRDHVREKEWNHFFHPSTITSSTDNNAHLSEHEKYGIRPGGNRNEKGGNEVPTNVEKEKPNFGLSGKLTAETNTFRGVVIKYSEPPEARKPQKIRWRLYPFKENESLPVMYIHRQSAYLLGRDRKIADIPIDHPSCSKQHAAIQYRLMPYKRSDGTMGRRIKPYIIDLESGNGTFLNGVKIESKRYVELFEKDALKFGFSSREYIVLHENSKDEPEEDEVGLGSASPLPAIKGEKKPNLGNES